MFRGFYLPSLHSVSLCGFLSIVLSAFQVTSNAPPTPPSPSAALAIQQKSSKDRDYLLTTKKMFTNWPFIISFLSVGGATGYVNTISTKIEQILCSVGYSDQIAGQTVLYRKETMRLTQNLKGLMVKTQNPKKFFKSVKNWSVQPT